MRGLNVFSFCSQKHRTVNAAESLRTIGSAIRVRSGWTAAIPAPVDAIGLDRPIRKDVMRRSLPVASLRVSWIRQVQCPAGGHPGSQTMAGLARRHGPRKTRISFGQAQQHMAFG